MPRTTTYPVELHVKFGQDLANRILKAASEREWSASQLIRYATATFLEREEILRKRADGERMKP